MRRSRENVEEYIGKGVAKNEEHAHTHTHTHTYTGADPGLTVGGG